MDLLMPKNPPKKSRHRQAGRQAHKSSTQLLRGVPKDLIPKCQVDYANHISVSQVKTLRLESFSNLPKLSDMKQWSWQTGGQWWESQQDRMWPEDVPTSSSILPSKFCLMQKEVPLGLSKAMATHYDHVLSEFHRWDSIIQGRVDALVEMPTLPQRT